MNKRTVCVFTGTRAEYGLLRPLMTEIRKDKALNLHLLVSGMHLSPEFGLTYREIENDGFTIDEKVEILLSSDTPVAVCKSLSLGVAGCAEALDRIRPNILVILGDRFEALAVATAAMILKIPIAHLNGGEATYGLIDEAIRHSISKMSHLHFTSTEEYRKRVIQLGENPKTVFNVGSTSLDNIRKLKLLSRDKLEKELFIHFRQRNYLVTFHPVTLDTASSKHQIGNLLNVLAQEKNAAVIFTKANADCDGRIINEMIEKFVNVYSERAYMFPSLGTLNYLSVMKQVDAVVGNSSSGIIEAPSLHIGTIDIGDRQEGRIRAKSVIHCEPDEQAIRAALKKLHSPFFQTTLKRVVNPYGDGKTSSRIRNILKTFDIEGCLKKKFYNINMALYTDS